MLLDALVNWVENGVPPDYLIQQVNATRTRKVCMYPNTLVYTGSGSIDDQANFACQTNANDDPALVAKQLQILQGNSPLSDNNDIDRLP